MKKILILLSLCSLTTLIFGCGNSAADNASSELFTTPVSCGIDNGIPKLCRTERVTEYSVNVDNLLRFTQCGKLRTWMSFDPYVDGACGGVNAGKFVAFGPFLTIKAPGQIVAKVHVLPGKLMGSWPSNYAPNDPMFAVDIYSATLGGSLTRPDPFDYSDFIVDSVQGVHVAMAFSGIPSPLAQGKNLPEGWKVIEMTARVPSEITDLEVRVQSIHPHMNVSVLGIEITHIKD